MPDASPATPGDLMIDENYVPSPLMSSSQNSSTLKSSPVTVKYVRSDKTITNEENEKVIIAMIISHIKLFPRINNTMKQY